MLDAPEFERWQRSADDALAGAAVQRDAALHNWACFLAEQAAQLSCKGLLHGLGADAWGHDLVDLGDRLADAIGSELEDEVLASLRRLSRHYVVSRYPDAHPAGAPATHYGREDADEAIADAQRILATVHRAWDDLQELSDTADPSHDPRGAP
jgi:HEPN domain-containing protein